MRDGITGFAFWFKAAPTFAVNLQKLTALIIEVSNSKMFLLFSFICVGVSLHKG